MAPSGEMMYGYDVNWKPKQTVHQTRKQDPWKQNLPYQRSKGTAIPAEEAGRQKTESTNGTPQIPASQAAKGDSVRVGEVANPYSKVNAQSCRTLLNHNGDEGTTERIKNTKHDDQKERLPNQNIKKPQTNAQQHISVIWGNRKDQDHIRSRKTYSQILGQQSEASDTPPPAPCVQSTQEVPAPAPTKPAQNTEASQHPLQREVSPNPRNPKITISPQHSELPSVCAASTVVSKVQRKPQKSPRTNYHPPNKGKDVLVSGALKTSPVTRPSSTDSTSAQENANKLAKQGADTVPSPHGEARGTAMDTKSKENSGGKNKKAECIVKVAAWSKWKPACDAFMKTQWMFKYRIDQIAVAKHPDHYIVGRG